MLELPQLKIEYPGGQQCDVGLFALAVIRQTAKRVIRRLQITLPNATEHPIGMSSHLGSRARAPTRANEKRDAPSLDIPQLFHCLCFGSVPTGGFEPPAKGL